MKTAYSCVVDGSPKFEWQAVSLCSSLMHNCGVSGEDIKVHVTPSVSDVFRDFALDHGLTLISIEPFAAHGYCNKIQQMFSSAFVGYEKAVLCDCDLIFVRPPDLGSIAAAAAGRVVDRPNPPLELLLRLFAIRGIAPSPDTAVGFPNSDVERTVTSNWNGGLYVFDTREMPAWGRAWAECATSLLSDATLLGAYGNHVDQISWALTLDRLSIGYATLPNENNYPIHLGRPAESRPPPLAIASFHYHDRMDALGKLLPTGVAEIDEQIGAANEEIARTLTSRIIRDPALLQLFQRWQEFCGSVPAEAIPASLAAFQNPRYIRHNARRLEHLASLDLDLRDKSVLEFGAGVGDHSSFFLDRGCSVTSIEPREENVACILRRHRSEPVAFPKGRHNVIRCNVDAAATFLHNARFQIVYSYGLLYHLSDPEAFLRGSAGYCEGLYLLETAVGDLTQTTNYVEDASDVTNGVDGSCRLLSRNEIFEILRQCLPFVYMPVVQPAHEQFLCDWSLAPVPDVNRHRAVFVGSMAPLPATRLAARVLERHDK